MASIKADNFIIIDITFLSNIIDIQKAPFIH